MKVYSSYRRTIQTISVILQCVFLLTKCISEKKEEKQGERKSRRSKLLNGLSLQVPQPAQGCHRNIYE